jgi:hypothetical protein
LGGAWCSFISSFIDRVPGSSPGASARLTGIAAISAAIRPCHPREGAGVREGGCHVATAPATHRATPSWGPGAGWRGAECMRMAREPDIRLGVSPAGSRSFGGWFSARGAKPHVVVAVVHPEPWLAALGAREVANPMCEFPHGGARCGGAAGERVVVARDGFEVTAGWDASAFHAASALTLGLQFQNKCPIPPYAMQGGQACAGIDIVSSPPENRFT